MRAIGRDVEAANAERRNARDAHVALRDRLPLHGDLVDDQPDRERRHREVVAAQPQRRIADDERAGERAERCRAQRRAGAPSRDVAVSTAEV